MPSEERRRVSDLDTLKAIGHPLRLKLYRALHIKRTATASQLADQVDEAVSLVSYHLRKLADHGLIEPAEGQGTDGRERWWQPSSRGLTFSDEDFDDAPDKAAVYAAMRPDVLRPARRALPGPPGRTAHLGHGMAQRLLERGEPPAPHRGGTGRPRPGDGRADRPLRGSGPRPRGSGRHGRAARASPCTRTDSPSAPEPAAPPGRTNP